MLTRLDSLPSSFFPRTSFRQSPEAHVLGLRCPAGEERGHAGMRSEDHAANMVFKPESFGPHAALQVPQVDVARLGREGTLAVVEQDDLTHDPVWSRVGLAERLTAGKSGAGCCASGRVSAGRSAGIASAASGPKGSFAGAGAAGPDGVVTSTRLAISRNLLTTALPPATIKATSTIAPAEPTTIQAIVLTGRGLPARRIDWDRKRLPT